MTTPRDLPITEKRNPRSENIDERSTLEIVTLIGQDDMQVPQAVEAIPAEIIINPVVGPEIVTGSTRMKAGTATKLVLNTLTTTAMIKLGKVYGNLMVDLRAVNNKLRDRSVRIVMDVTGLSRRRAQNLLDRAEGRVKPALVMHFRRVDLDGALEILKTHRQLLRPAIAKPSERT